MTAETCAYKENSSYFYPNTQYLVKMRQKGAREGARLFPAGSAGKLVLIIFLLGPRDSKHYIRSVFPFFSILNTDLRW